MRLAGSIPDELALLIAAADNSAEWPSILRPVKPKPAEYRYDEHMKEYVPNMPRRV
jgi:hypothetical protein